LPHTPCRPQPRARRASRRYGRRANLRPDFVRLDRTSALEGAAAVVRRDADQVALIASIARETPAQEVKWPRWQRSCDMRYEDKTRQPQHVTWIEAELNGVQPRRWAASDHRRHGRGRSSHIAYGPSSRSHGRL